jgi:hypothetical protein
MRPSAQARKQETDWQVPPLIASPQSRVAWVEEQIEEGEGWLESQTCYKDLGKNLRIFDAVFEDKTKSTLISNGLKYDIRKFVETISEVREIGTYASDAVQFKSYANIENKVASGIYLESFFPGSIRKVLQYSTVMGRGYIWPKCKTGNYGFGERKIVFEALGPIDLVPVQIPATNDVQDAYANTAYVYMPIAEAHGRFPLFQSQLVPVSALSYRTRVQARRVDYAERVSGGPQARNWGNLYCEIRYTYVRDISVNRYGKELPMGDPGTSWFYKVPSIGAEIPGGIKNGTMTKRKARAEDCLIYPYLRLIITSKGIKTPLYDGPAFDWHGEMPFVQYDVDDWAWEGMGRSLIQDVGSIETTKRKIERQMDQVTTTTLNPPMGYDRNAVQGPKIENFDIFEQNQRAGMDGKPRDTLQSLLPEEVRVTDIHFKFIEYLANMRKEQLGINDIANLANMKLNLQGDNIDKALEPVGPIAKGIAAGMERSNAKIAYMLKFMIPQWYDTKRIIEYIGPDNITQAVLDYDPSSLVPSHMPDEYVNGDVPMVGEGENLRMKESQYEQVYRARWFAKNVRLIAVPNTLLKITAQAEQLKWLQLKKTGAPISWATTLKKLGVENYGDVKGNTEREKYINEQIEDLKLKAEAAKLMQALGLNLPEAGPGQGKGGGRPSSGKKPPKVSSKGGAGGEPRTVLKES